MDKLKNVLSREEIAAFSLRSLYNEYGYTQYRMSKFEEYDLYVKNKDFLVSENIITFNDTDGKLLALKPDVTLSIIKNSKDAPERLTKVYYNENVYRVSKGTKSFKEIMQAGLECLGNVDDTAITEVLLLAAKSLEMISMENALEVSHLGIVSGVLQAAGGSELSKKEILQFLGQKNLQGIRAVCEREGVSEELTQAIEKLVTLYGSPEKVLPALESLKINGCVSAAIDQLTSITDKLKVLGVSDKLCIDFSVDGDMRYYNGIVFKGFVERVPVSILSGGQYDGLMQRMHKKSKAIGFAVYLDEIFRLPEEEGGRML